MHAARAAIGFLVYLVNAAAIVAVPVGILLVLTTPHLVVGATVIAVSLAAVVIDEQLWSRAR